MSLTAIENIMAVKQGMHFPPGLSLDCRDAVFWQLDGANTAEIHVINFVLQKVIKIFHFSV